MSEEKKVFVVPFNVTLYVPYSRCRSCNQKIIWWNVQLEEKTLVPYILKNQNPGEKEKAFCPYCGKQELYAEDGSCLLKRRRD